MKIGYPKKRLKSNLFFGIIWSTFGIIAFIFNPEVLFNFGYLFLGLAYLTVYLFENSKQYLTIENGIITKHNIRQKSVKLKDIVHIKNFAGDYILKTKQDEFTINKSFIEKNSLLDLEKVFNSLGLSDKEMSTAPSNLS